MLEDLACCRHGAQRIVVARARCAEDRHDAVAVELVQQAGVGEHDVDHRPEIAVEQLDDVFGHQALRQFREASDIREHHGRRLTRAAEHDRFWIFEQRVHHMRREVTFERPRDALALLRLRQVFGGERAALGEIVEHDGRAEAAACRPADPEERDLQDDMAADEVVACDFELHARLGLALVAFEQRREPWQPRVEDTRVAADEGRCGESERELRRAVELADRVLRVQHHDARRYRFEDLVVLRLDRRLLAQAAAQVLVEARVVDRDRGLVGDRAEQLRVVVREPVGPDPRVDVDDADDAVAVRDRHADDRTDVQRAHAGRRVKGRIVLRVGRHHGFARAEDALDDRAAHGERRRADVARI